MKPPRPFTVEIRKSKMPRRKHKRPSDPAEIARKIAEARRDPTKWGWNEEAFALPSAADVELDRASRQNEKRAQRFDIFARFYRDGSLERRGLEAVRRLQEDLAILHRTTGVSGSGIIAPHAPEGELAMIDAGKRIEAARNATGGHSWAILMALCERDLTADIRDWRSLVESVTREHNVNAQGALVRAAAMNLADAYDAGVRAPRKAA